MPTAKQCKAPPTKTWDEKCRAAIASGDADAVDAIQNKLDELTKAARARAIVRALDSEPEPSKTVEEWVELVKSSEDHDQDFSCNGASREVKASFVAGPNAASFFIDFQCNNIEGKNTRIDVDSDLFSYRTSGYEGNLFDVDDEKIERTLRRMGFIRDRDPNLSAVRPTEYHEENKYGRVSGPDVELGLRSDEIYGILGLQ